MRVVHPEALDGVGGHCPDTVWIAGEGYDCADGAEVDLPEGQAEALASRYGVELSDIRVDSGVESQTECSQCGQSHDDGACWDLVEQGVCPWCDDYEGDHIGQHASSAHPDEWATYKEGEA